MKVIKIDLPKDVTEIELHIFADEHIGDELCDLERLKERIKYVAETPNAYCLLNGDILDNATKTSIGDTYTQEFNPMEQLQKAVEIFSPIKDKCLAVTHGNHENRTYRKEGINLSYLLSAQLGLTDKYSPTSALVFVRFGKSKNNGGTSKQCYTVFLLHGSGGGKKEGAKAIRLADLNTIIDADIFVHSHTHLPMIMKQAYHRIDRHNSTVALVDKLFVNTAANLNYGGYGEAGAFKPNSKDTPIIYLSGTKKEMTAKL
jgi:predicted phosphodiesterase